MKKKTLRIIFIIIIILFIVYLAQHFLLKKNNSETLNIHGKPTTSQIQAICELAVMDTYYHNVGKYNKPDATGVLFWKKDRRFWVTYDCIVQVGIDATKLQLEVNDNDVTVKIPKAKILNVKVNSESLNDDSFYIEPGSAKIAATDQQEVHQQIDADFRKKASEDSVLMANAEQRVQSLIENYINNIGSVTNKEYNITWVYLDEE